MTRKEINEKYGKCWVDLRSGFKHTFTYRGESPSGDNLEVTVGDGTPETIYRTQIDPIALVENLPIEEFYVNGNLMWEYGDV